MRKRYEYCKNGRPVHGCMFYRWGDVLVLKSGSEFREFSEITVTFPEGNGRSSSHNHAHRRPLIDVVRHEVTGSVTPE